MPFSSSQFVSTTLRKLTNASCCECTIVRATHSCTGALPFPVQSFASHVLPFPFHGCLCAVRTALLSYSSRFSLQPTVPSIFFTSSSSAGSFAQTIGQSVTLCFRGSDCSQLISPLLRAPIACYVSLLLLPSSSTVPCSVFVVILYLLGLFFYSNKDYPLPAPLQRCLITLKSESKGKHQKNTLYFGSQCGLPNSSTCKGDDHGSASSSPPPLLPMDFVEECVDVYQSNKDKGERGGGGGKVLALQALEYGKSHSFCKYSRQKKCTHNNRHLQL